MSFSKNSILNNQSQEQSKENESTFLNDSDFDFTDVTYKILRTLEKEPNDQNQRIKQTQNVNIHLAELQKQLNAARKKIMKIPGIEFSQDDQLKNLEKLHQNLIKKKELIAKYRNMTNV